MSIITMLLTCFLFGQPQAEKQALLFDSQEVAVYGVLEECSSPERSVIKKYMILTFENKTDKKVQVKFRRKAYFNGVCSNCDNEQSEFQVILNPGESTTGQCDVNNKALRVFHSFVTGESDSKLTNLEIAEVQTISLD